MHGSKTHGYGSMKKHRGAGHKGGKGGSGTGKKADQKKPSIWKDVDYFGRHGFISKSRTRINTVTLQYLDENADKLVKAGAISNKGGVYEIDVANLGFNKVIAKGQATKKMRVTAMYFSQGAVEKIKEAGGDVVVLASSDSDSAADEE